MPGVDVDAEKLHLALRLGCLTSRELCIDDLSTENVIVNVDTSKCLLQKKRRLLSH